MDVGRSPLLNLNQNKCIIGGSLWQTMVSSVLNFFMRRWTWYLLFIHQSCDTGKPRHSFQLLSAHFEIQCVFCLQILFKFFYLQLLSHINLSTAGSSKEHPILWIPPWIFPWFGRKVQWPFGEVVVYFLRCSSWPLLITLIWRCTGLSLSTLQSDVRLLFLKNAFVNFFLVGLHASNSGTHFILLHFGNSRFMYFSCHLMFLLLNFEWTKPAE